MSFARRPRARSFGLRLAVFSGALIFLTASAVAALVIWIASSAIYDQLGDALRAESAALLKRGTDGEIERAIKVAHENGGRFVYLLTDKDGEAVTGVLPARADWREGLDDRAWPESVRVESPAIADIADDERGERIVTYGARTQSGGLLIVGIDGENLIEAEEAFWTAAGWGLPLAALIGFGGAAAVGARYRRRVDAVVAKLGAVMGDDLSARMPVEGWGDEIDRLAEALNDMLTRLSASTESLRQLSSDIAHELRTPLSRLRQTLDEAARAGDLPAALRGIEDAGAEGDQLLATFSALLRIAQVEGGMQRAFARVDLSALLTRLGDVYTAVAEDSDHRLVLHVPPAMAIDGDADLLLQLFANLLDNALRHTPAGTTIRLSLDREESGILAVVQDDGPGAPEGDLPHLTERFYRAANVRATPGNGLGLAMVSAIAEAHRARIAITNEHPGLRVALTFPLRRADS